jgi:hypothetical protein
MRPDGPWMTSGAPVRGGPHPPERIQVDHLVAPARLQGPSTSSQRIPARRRTGGQANQSVLQRPRCEGVRRAGRSNEKGKNRGRQRARFVTCVFAGKMRLTSGRPQGRERILSLRTHGSALGPARCAGRRPPTY